MHKRLKEEAEKHWRELDLLWWSGLQYSTKSKMAQLKGAAEAVQRLRNAIKVHYVQGPLEWDEKSFKDEAERVTGHYYAKIADSKSAMSRWAYREQWGQVSDTASALQGYLRGVHALLKLDALGPYKTPMDAVRLLDERTEKYEAELEKTKEESITLVRKYALELHGE